MKKNLHIIIVLLALFALSCKKEHTKDNAPDDQLHTVTVKVNGNGFTQSIAQSNGLKVNAVTDPAQFRNYFDLLMVNIENQYPQAGTLLFNDSTKNITALNINIRRKAGTYKIFAYGAKYQFYKYGFYYYDPVNNKPLPWKDTFYGEQTFTITNADVAVNINLSRITALIEINITDVMPQQVNRLALDFTYGGTSKFDSIRVVVPEISKGKPNYKIEYFSINTKAPFDLVLKAYDKNNVPLGAKIIKNIKLEANQKSVFNGTLFGGPSSGSTSTGFPTKIDTTWNPGPVTTF